MQFAASDFLEDGIDLADPSLYRSGDTPVLPALAYRSPVFAAMEDERIWTPAWVCIGTQADIPEIGDLLPYTVGAQGVHVQRDTGGGLVGRYNKAQHGGCRFVPVQCQTGAKTSCSFTSCGYSRDRPPLRGAALDAASRETYQYLGLRPERLPAVPWAAVGSLLFVNCDPAWATLRAQPAPPQMPASWAPAPDAPRRHAQWHEAEANWKLLAQSLASGDLIDESTDGAWMHSRAVLPGGMPVEMLWLFPNLLLWRYETATWVCVLQPTATSRTLCRISLFGSAGQWEHAFAAGFAQAEQAQLAPADAAAAPHVVAFCNRQVAGHVLTSQPGYQPDLIAQQRTGAMRHG